MSQTSTSHTHWIQQAVAAAKAGNPSVAKIQLQKAAEAAPSDPAVWLWMGWLADSPASAAQCLELARSDERLQKIADAGIEFAKALAKFHLELPEELVTEIPSDESANDPDETIPVINPVEAVEEVADVVKSLQNEDAANTTVASDVEPSADGDDGEGEVSGLVEQVNKSGAAADEESPSPPDESAVELSVPSAVDTSDESRPESELKLEPEETVLVEPDDSSDDSDRPVSDDTDIVENLASDAAATAANDVETDLMKSANELWQTTENAADAAVADAATGTPANTAHEPPAGQQFWKPASSKNRTDRVEDVASAPVSAAEAPSDVFVDESENDFAFASGEDVEFKGFVPVRPNSKPMPTSDNTHTQPESQLDDQWLGQAPVNAPTAPVWRKAQSDWFSVDAPSDLEPTQPVSAIETQGQFPGADSPVTENSEAVVVRDDPAKADGQPPDLPSPAKPETDDSIFDEATVATTQKSTAPTSQHRITASDVWQTAAIEKSTLSEAPAIHLPIYQPAVAPLPAETGSLSASLEDVALQSPVNDSAGFSTADPPDSPFLAVNATADPLDRKTVLVVDDSPTVRKLVSITLEKRGYKVASAFDGVAAIKEIAAHNPALILMDVNMPRLDGYQLCKLVKKHETTCDIPVLMLSGTDGMFDRLRGRLVGCAGHVTKPFTPEVLIEAVEQHIKQVKEA